MQSRRVRSRIVLDVVEPADLLFSVAVAGSQPLVEESLVVTASGVPVLPVEIAGPHDVRVHQLHAGVGPVVLEYAAVVGQAPAPPVVLPYDVIEAFRPSRYCDSDRLGEVAAAHFDGLSGVELVRAGTQWILDNIMYDPGATRSTDGALETYLARRGVCRDSAHLLITFFRACDVSARLVSCYAPGLWPMDFHAVVEVYVEGGWYVVDGTGLAPRPSLVRIATGRDAADTAFLTVQGGRADLVELEVDARIDGLLPGDDGMQLVALS